MQTDEIEKNLADDRGRILVVDDDDLVLTALELTLRRDGYEVYTSPNGQHAVEMLKKISPAIIICDQTMPGMSGIEVMQQAQQILPDTIRILLTGSQDTETAVKAINIGQVNQYLTKPWKDTQLRKTIETSLEKYKLLMENRILQELILSQHQKLEKNHNNLCHELKLGGRIHEKLLLGKVPKNIPGFMIDALSSPSQEIDGDFFEFYTPSPQNLDIVFGDVMGKGIAAALVGNAVKTQMIRFAMPFPYTQIFDKQMGWYSNVLSPVEIIAHVHAEIATSLIELEYFVSLFYGRFDLRYKTFSYVDCGSTKPLHFKAKEGTTSELIGSNFPLGFVEDTAYRQTETSFSEGDIFLFYSDGVTEARSLEGEYFGVERLRKLVEGNNDLGAHALLDLVKQAVFNFTRQEKHHDDLTIIVIKIGYYDRPDLAQNISTEFCSDLSQLQAIRDLVKRFCLKAPGDSERLASEMELAINEAFCNVVQHGHLENAKQTIRLKMELRGEGVVVQVSDQGLPFDPAEVNEPSFSGNRDTGYGWHIIKELADVVSYTRRQTLQGWNHLCFYKRFYFGDHQDEL